MSGINAQLGTLGIKIEVPGVAKVKDDLNKVADSFKKTATAAKQTKEEADKLAKAASRTSRGMLELGRGAEDAAVGFGINGFQGAMRGSINNLTQFATIMAGPMAGAIAGAVAAGATMIPIFIGMANSAKEAAEGIEELNEALQRQNKLQLQNLKFGFQRRDIAAAGSVKGATAAERRAQDAVGRERIKLEGAENQRAERIKAFGTSKLFEGLALTQGQREDILDAILRQQGEKFGDRASGFAGIKFAELEKKRATVREDLSLGLVPAKQIESAVRSQTGLTRGKAFDTLVTRMDDFLKKTTDGVLDATIALDRLKGEVRVLADDAKKLADDPKSKEAVKKREEAQKKDVKAAKDEETRLNKRRDLFSKLLNVFDPKEGKLFDIDERRIAREKQIAGFQIPDAEKRQFTTAARQVAAIERKKVFADEQKRADKIQDDAENAEARDERIRKAELKGFGDFAKSFLPPDARRQIKLDEEIAGVRGSRFLDAGQKESTIFGLRGLSALDEERRGIQGARKPGASFAGVAEFAKQFQSSVTKFGGESKENSKLEQIGEKQTQVLDKILKAVKKDPNNEPKFK